MNTEDLYDTDGWTVDRVLLRQAGRRPDHPFVSAAGETLTYAEAWSRSGQCANLFADLGVGFGNAVAVMLPSGMPFCLSWLGLARLGAVMVAVNTDYVGSFLVHVLNNCRAKVLVVDAQWLPRIEAVRDQLSFLQGLCVVGKPGLEPSLAMRDFDEWKRFEPRCDVIGPTYRDTGCVMYTSGTTGPSKGVVMPHAHLYLFGLGTIEHMGLTERDVFYIVLPLFHANGLFMQLYATMIAGARAVVRERFSASRWLADIVEHGATVTNSLGAVAAFVLEQPPSDLDRRHGLRAMSLAPTGEDLVRRLKERFGIEQVFGLYGMTEVNIPLYTPPGAPKGASCGRLWSAYYELRINDPETDEPLQAGLVGEIVVRPKQPYGFMSGYLDMPDKTVEAWRNFWFHTGDAAWMDEDGDVFFVDRIKDCIRRRGENVSSYEVENVLAAHPGVKEVAAYAVPSPIDGAEDEVMVALITDPDGGSTDADSVHAMAREQLPRFAVPRYYRFVDDLPRTPTGKVKKHVLRSEGITEDTVDAG